MKIQHSYNTENIPILNILNARHTPKFDHRNIGQWWHWFFSSLLGTALWPLWGGEGLSVGQAEDRAPVLPAWPPVTNHYEEWCWGETADCGDRKQSWQWGWESPVKGEQALFPLYCWLSILWQLNENPFTPGQRHYWHFIADPPGVTLGYFRQIIATSFVCRTNCAEVYRGKKASWGFFEWQVDAIQKMISMCCADQHWIVSFVEIAPLWTRSESWWRKETHATSVGAAEVSMYPRWWVQLCQDIGALIHSSLILKVTGHRAGPVCMGTDSIYMRPVFITSVWPPLKSWTRERRVGFAKYPTIGKGLL